MKYVLRLDDGYLIKKIINFIEGIRDKNRLRLRLLDESKRLAIRICWLQTTEKLNALKKKNCTNTL